MSWLRPLIVSLGACSVLGCSDDAEELTHGYVQIEFRRGESQSSNPYVGTQTVVVSAAYLDCLREFYQDQPTLKQTGPDGDLIFGSRDLGGEGWLDRLCDPDIGIHADCTVASIKQSVDTPGSEKLTVTYTITGDLEGRRLLFGPLPTEDLAACTAGNLPTVRGLASTLGQDGAGNTLWVTESLQPSEAVTNQGGRIVFKAKKLAGS